jgi:dihydroxycyclohexadiene carboxylate dehydrogenase
MSFPSRFAGKVMIVTGGAQGIGHAVAARAVAEGAQVLIADRADFVTEAAEMMGASGILVDLETHAGAAQAVTRAVELFGRIDILINNVGGAIRMRPYADFTPEQIDARNSPLLFPTLYACHAVLPVMLGQGRGTIVNVSSNATRHTPCALFGGQGRHQCADAKSGHGIWADGIRVVASAGRHQRPPRRIPATPPAIPQNKHGWHKPSSKSPNRPCSSAMAPSTNRSPPSFPRF